MTGTVYLAIEFNYGKVGGIFTSEQMAKWWCDSIEAVEPNLMWEVKPFELDAPISQEAAVEDARD